MKEIITTEKIPIKLWLDDMESGALQQARNLANLPFAFSHIAIMPDSHQGFGMPIGGVLATKGHIIPNAVGVDIGCGMCARRTNLDRIDRKQLERIIAEIRKLVPVGFQWHKSSQNADLMPNITSKAKMPVVSREYGKALKQIGTLGGGNHFIEVQSGSDGYLWIMVHSGSRNIGKQVAEHYNRIAIDLNRRSSSGIPKAWQLAFLPLDSAEAESYLLEMRYCVDFARRNRALMMTNIKRVFSDVMGIGIDDYGEMIDIFHNFAAMERHFDTEVAVHRKGATQARQGQPGIIPGSQGAKSYIVRGRGNPESFESCSHGAGRKMGRKQAIRELSVKTETAGLNNKGIIHSITTAKDLDEAPGAYKDIGTVMENQQDLVEIVVELHPLAVIKG